LPSDNFGINRPKRAKKQALVAVVQRRKPKKHPFHKQKHPDVPLDLIQWARRGKINESQFVWAILFNLWRFKE